MKGIDVAKWNGIIDWKKVKESGVEFAILKIINKQCQKEDAFERNYNGAISQGLPVDVYNYSYALTVDKAISDAKTVLSVISGKKIGTVWLDIEDKSQMNLGMTLIEIIKSYKNIIESAGYKFGVYTGLSFYNSFIKPFHTFVDCPFWIARYPSKEKMDFSDMPREDKKPSTLHPLWGWQYTSTGRVDGIAGNVDLSLTYEVVEREEELEDTRKTIKFGDYGVHVVYLQQRLTSKGYGVGTIDGKFGNKTLEAVKAFQAENNLMVDGIVGINTWNALENKEGVMVKEYSLSRDGEMQISENFKVKEFRCKDGSDKILIDTDFVVNKLQKIREHFSAPVTINSAYRTESYNKKVGGAKSSYHMKGQAFDIVVKGKTPLEVARFAQTIGITGIIQYNTFVHVDSRPTKYWARNDNGKIYRKETFM
jgi:GH25 family lysozyme M1 (1,4-beta-N-acetylmuramidase)/uncharacterized protein YcbK (DUF882 family)